MHDLAAALVQDRLAPDLRGDELPEVTRRDAVVFEEFLAIRHFPHNIISDIIDWDQANEAYSADEGQSGERYVQRLEAAGLIAEIEPRYRIFQRV